MPRRHRYSRAMSSPPQITHMSAAAYRVPLESPVSTSFGRMFDRPAVFLRVEASDGAFGWGEVFANWPAAGAEHRVRLLERDIAPLVLGQPADMPQEVTASLMAATHIRALQCGEPGPFAQVIAGLDIALWDMAARRAGLPLRRVLSDTARDSVPVYASGIQIDAAERLIAGARAQGIAAFKLKVGFDADRDPRLLAEIRRSLAAHEDLACDANQGWSADQALQFLGRLEAQDLLWLEEPIIADAPDACWARIAAATPIPLAAGENIAGLAAFEAVIAAGHIRVFQPDVAKWGGLSGCRKVAQAATAAGHRYCPHFLGGGIGLIASAELLAAVGGTGLLELDVNPNPLREDVLPDGLPLSDGLWQCSAAPGLGIETLPPSLDRFQTATAEISA